MFTSSFKQSSVLKKLPAISCQSLVKPQFAIGKQFDGNNRKEKIKNLVVGATLAVSILNAMLSSSTAS